MGGLCKHGKDSIRNKIGVTPARQTADNQNMVFDIFLMSDL